MLFQNTVLTVLPLSVSVLCYCVSVGPHNASSGKVVESCCINV